MSRFLVCTLAVLGLLMTAAPVQKVSAAESYDNCTGFITSLPAVVSTQGVWCLKANLETAISSGAAITIGTNNVTIDCNDFKIGGLQAGIATQANGIYASGRLNATIRRCNVRGFRYGINLFGDGALIEHDRLDLNTTYVIYADSDSGVLRENIVNDTGGAPASSQAIGIYTNGTSTIDGNIITNVLGTANTNTTVYGMRVVGGEGAVVVRNAVRGVAPTGTGSGNGIYTTNGMKVMITDNRVSAASGTTGEGFRCNASNGSLKGNVAWGFSDALDAGGCIDDGGNAGH